MRPRLLKANSALAAIVAEGFLSRLSFGFISFALPLYAFRQGMSLATIGILLSFNLIFAIPLKPSMAWLADRFGLKRALAAAIALRSVVPVLLIFDPSPWQLFVIRGLHGVSIALRDPAVNALIAEVGGKKAVASAFAWYQTGKSVAGTSGKALAGILLGLPTGSFRFVFAAAFVLSVLPMLAIRRVPEEDHHPDAASAHLKKEGGVATAAPLEGNGQPGHKGHRSPLPYAVLGLLISGTAFMMANLFPILATEYAGLTEAQTGFIYVLSIVAILTGPLWGWLSDNVSRQLVLSVRGAANTVSSLLYLLAPNLFGMAAGRVTDDVGKAAFRPGWGAIMAELALVDRRRRARVMAYLTVGEDIGEVAAPVIAGLLWSVWGVVVVLVSRIVLAVLTEAYAYRLMRSPPGGLTQPAHRFPSRSLTHTAPQRGKDPSHGRPALLGQSTIPFSQRLAATLSAAAVLGYVGIAISGADRKEPARAPRAETAVGPTGRETSEADDLLGPQARKITMGVAIELIARCQCPQVPRSGPGSQAEVVAAYTNEVAQIGMTFDNGMALIYTPDGRTPRQFAAQMSDIIADGKWPGYLMPVRGVLAAARHHDERGPAVLTWIERAHKVGLYGKGGQHLSELLAVAKSMLPAPH